MEAVQYTPIGIVRSPFTKPEGTPIQSAAAETGTGRVEVFPGFEVGLRDLEGFSHIILLYHCHRAGAAELQVKPFLDDRTHGIFATRAPARPNPIGLSVVRLMGIEATDIRVRDLDVLDGTPVLDIKPYVPKFDVRRAVRTGWLEEQADRLSTTTDDGRFSQ